MEKVDKLVSIFEKLETQVKQISDSLPSADSGLANLERTFKEEDGLLSSRIYFASETLKMAELERLADKTQNLTQRCLISAAKDCEQSDDLRLTIFGLYENSLQLNQTLQNLCRSHAHVLRILHYRLVELDLQELITLKQIQNELDKTIYYAGMANIADDRSLTQLALRIKILAKKKLSI